MNFEEIYEKTQFEPEKLTLVTWPDPRLKKVCEDVNEFDTEESKELESFVVNMIETMMKNRAIGLAAPQVGVNKNIIVLLVENKPVVLVNPVIENQSDDMYEWEEGCLSVPGYFEKRERPVRAIVSFKDIFGKDHSVEFIGLWSFAVQHEIDHLHGKCFVDEMGPIKKLFIRKKINKYLKKKKKSK